MKRNARAFGIRGLGSLIRNYSDGIDEQVAALNLLGIEATAHIQGFLWPNSNVPNIANQAMEAASQGKKIILLGHSMGADAAVKVAVRLRAAGYAVDLLACFDPTTFGCPDVPANVKKTLGWWQPVGLGGYQVRPSVELSDALEQGGAWLSTRAVKSSHKNIDNDPALQKIFLHWADKVTTP